MRNNHLRQIALILNEKESEKLDPNAAPPEELTPEKLDLNAVPPIDDSMSSPPLEEPLTKDQIKKYLLFKKINEQLVKLNKIADSDKYVNTNYKDSLMDAIEYYTTILDNIKTYEDELDNINDYFLKFIKNILNKMIKEKK